MQTGIVWCQIHRQICPMWALGRWEIWLKPKQTSFPSQANATGLKFQQPGTKLWVYSFKQVEATPDGQPDQIKRSTFISFGESRARSNSGGREKKEDLVTLAFPSFFLVCSVLHYLCVSASPARPAGCISKLAQVSVCKTTERADPLWYVQQSTLQRAQQTTLHYCMITICCRDWGLFWEGRVGGEGVEGFKSGSYPSGDSSHTSSSFVIAHN